MGVFLVWRLSRAWDLDEEKILDLTLLTFIGGLVSARVYFVLGHLDLFTNNWLGAVLINKVPGFSFWGAILGSWLTLYYFTRSKKENFWQVSDIASVGLLGGLIFTSLGCFLGGCNVGIQSNLPLAVNMVGVLGKRLPIQLLEAILLALVLKSIWSAASHFHPRGKIISLTLIYIGLIKFLIESLTADRDEGLFLSVVLFFLGLVIFYKVTDRNPIADLKQLGSIPKLITDSASRQAALQRVQKYWYNQISLILWKIRNLKKTLRRLNVRFSFKNNKLY